MLVLRGLSEGRSRLPSEAMLLQDSPEVPCTGSRQSALRLSESLSCRWVGTCGLSAQQVSRGCAVRSREALQAGAAGAVGRPQLVMAQAARDTWLRHWAPLRVIEAPSSMGPGPLPSKHKLLSTERQHLAVMWKTARQEVAGTREESGPCNLRAAWEPYLMKYTV